MQTETVENRPERVSASVQILTAEQAVQARERARRTNRVAVADALHAVRLRRDGLDQRARVLGRHLELLDSSGPVP